MILKKIREGKFSKVIASYLSIQLLLQVAGGSNIYALTSGPSQPEFNSFTPIGTSDMVDLSSGDFSYNIPVIDVGGYPLNLSYKSGITMDQEASWVGLGWNLNIGQINRQMRGLPDDFDGTKGDEMLYENNMRDNITVGAAVNLNPQLLGYEPPETPPPAPDPDASPVPQFNVGLGIKYNNYTGVSWEPTAGFTFELTKGVSVGMDVSTTASGGVNLAPNTNFSKRIGESKLEHINGIFGGLGIGTSFNSRQGITGISMSAGVNASYKEAVKMELSDYKMNMTSANNSASLGGASSSISFINNTFTPMKRTAINNNSFTMSFSTGLSAWGLDGEGGVTAYGTIQSVKDKQISVPAFGYENDHKGNSEAVLDFNRENDRIVSKNTTVLPTTNNTYDIYSINGQGISGMFRPHRSQTGYIYDRFVEDGSTSFQLGLEAEIGAGAHYGFDARYTDVESSTGLWNTPAANSFKEKDLTEYDYRKSYFKRLGDLSVDKESDLLNEDLHGNKAMAVKVSGVAYGNNFNRSLESAYVVKNSETDYSNELFESEFRRTKRETPNETIEKIINDEAGEALDPFIKKEELLKGHHTVGMRLLQPDGSTYVYGETAVNTKKQEVTFATEENKDCLTGLINTVDGTENSSANESGQDQMFNRVSTPAYAHTYLLTSILSSDYEDVNGNGPDHRDLGSYTKFSYDKTVDDYKWRLPYYGATHDEGFKTIKDDQKASYVYGEKELKYVTKIETKTHVARIEFEERRDGTEAYHENASLSNGQGTQNMKKIKRIYLFSKPEYDQLIAEGISFDGTIDETSNEYKQITKAAIKVAHFEYDYSLCKDVYNNNNQSYLDPDGNEANQGGKLTLKKVFFTYRGSEMGRYTPYKFNYDGFNPNYNFKSYDVWGNYKPIVSDIVSTNSDGTVEYDDNVSVSCGVTSSVTAPEYPYVQQDDKNLQDAYASAWSLTSIDLPSGGKMNVEYETDDYQYVQDKKAMQMFKVVGSSNSPTSLGDNRLYNGISDDDNYLVVEIPEAIGSNYSYAEFLEEYIGDQLDKPIFFRFLLNMHRRPANGNFSRDEMDYVEGYFKLDHDGGIGNTFDQGGKMYASIKMRTTGIHNSDDDGINPISKAGWHFGRKYMNQTVYTGNTTPSSTNPLTIAKDLFQAIGEIRNIASGPNRPLRQKGIAKVFMPDKSFIRLLSPNGRKMGGGVRVKKIRLEDNWDVMVDSDISYRSDYGQEYNYDLPEGKGTSGVATFEPNGNKENPFVTPFYDNDNMDRWLNPKEVSYTEKPFASSFYPSPTVTYSRVEVKNLDRERVDGVKVTRHATGKVVSEFFTSKDFPTKSDITAINGEINKPHYDSNEGNFLDSFLNSVLKIKVKTHLSASQGFVVETNDMNGKQKAQAVYDENGVEISGVEYKYSVSETDATQLNNKLPVITSKGEVETHHELGVDYEVINDFRKATTKTTTSGAHINTAIIPLGFPIPFFIIPTIMSMNAKHENILKMATTTKVIHRSGIMIEKIARDLGATVSTKNKAWDAETGQILLTETVNEYDDHYFNTSYPVHWYYDGMRKASNNIGIEGTLTFVDEGYFSVSDTYGNAIDDVRKVFKRGDEIIFESDFATGGGLSLPGQLSGASPNRLWVADFNDTNNQVLFLNARGSVFDLCEGANGPVNLSYKFKIKRSGYRNQQMATMASVTSMVNPIDTNSDGEFNNFSEETYAASALTSRVVNASAVEYSNFWKAPRERKIPILPLADDGTTIDSEDEINFKSVGVNPYLFNILGEHRAIKSYAYLTGRNTSSVGVSTRNEGFFNAFSPFYQLNTNNTSDTSDDEWNINSGDWVSASEVTQYSPYGAELENKDALDRYAAAQYGYDYTLPIAVASNSEYGEIGFDGAEDYDYNTFYDEASNSQLSKGSSHFSFYSTVNSSLNASRTSEEAHTGRYSIEVLPNQSVTKRDYFEDCNYVKQEPLCCPEGYQPNADGTECDLIPNNIDLIGDECPEINITLNTYDSSLPNSTTTTGTTQLAFALENFEITGFSNLFEVYHYVNQDGFSVITINLIGDIDTLDCFQNVPDGDDNLADFSCNIPYSNTDCSGTIWIHINFN